MENSPRSKNLKSLSNDVNPWTRCILVVDDDEAIRHMLSDKLEYEGYEVWTAFDGQHALDTLRRRGLPHLAIVDIHMPGMDGFEFCETVHQYADLPIILLTAVDNEETIIWGIKNVAEDYVTKPFSPRQLAARVERVLRRTADFAHVVEPKVKIDEFLEVHLAHQEAVVNGDLIRLTPIENKILHILMTNAPRVVPTRFLLDRIWPQDEVLEDVLRVHVHRLRGKIERNPGSLKYILTERGVGYRFGKVW